MGRQTKKGTGERLMYGFEQQRNWVARLKGPTSIQFPRLSIKSVRFHYSPTIEIASAITQILWLEDFNVTGNLKIASGDLTTNTQRSGIATVGWWRTAKCRQRKTRQLLVAVTYESTH